MSNRDLVSCRLFLNKVNTQQGGKFPSRLHYNSNVYLALVNVTVVVYFDCKTTTTLSLSAFKHRATLLTIADSILCQINLETYVLGVRQ